MVRNVSENERKHRVINTKKELDNFCAFVVDKFSYNFQILNFEEVDLAFFKKWVSISIFFK